MNEEKEKGQNPLGAGELHYWQFGKNPTNFNSHIFILLQKADATNRYRIASGWPWLYFAWREWTECESQETYFERYGLPLNGDKYS